MEEIILEEISEEVSDENKEQKNIENKKKNKKKRSFLGSNIFRLFIAVLMLCACAGLGAGIAILEDKSDPTELVAGYFGKFLMQDYEGMMEYVDTSDSLITKESFVNLMSNLRAENNVGEYEFEKVEKVGDRYLMRVLYKDGETGEEKNFDIYLKKHKKKVTQLVADWQICIDDSFVRNYVVQIPEGMTLEIDGRVITDDDAALQAGEDIVKTAEGETIVINPSQEGDETGVTYRINNIIKGKHRLEATSEFTQIVREVDVAADNQNDVLKADEAKVHENYLKLIETTSPEMIKEYYEVVRNRKNSSDKLKAYFVDDKKLLKSVEKEAKKSQEIIFWPDTKNIDDYSLIQCNFSELQYTAQYVGENKLKATYTFSYDYVSSTNTELYTSYVFSISGTCKTTMEITYVAENGGIKISEISIKNNNKKNVEEE